MQKTLFILSIALLSISCEDDDTTVAPEPHNALLTRVSRNGNTTVELHYDVEKNLYRVDYYYMGDPASYIIYEYDEKGLKELRKYEAIDLQPSYRIVFSLDNFGKAIKADHYFKPQLDQVKVTIEYDYNSSGQLIAQDLGSPGEPLYSREEYTYDTNNKLRRVETTYHPGQDEEYLGSVYEYTPGDHSIPDAWQNYLFPLTAFGFDETILDMFNITTHFKAWSSSGELEYESRSEMSEQVFDEENNLTRQVVTRKNLLELENPPAVNEMVYDYAVEY